MRSAYSLLALASAFCIVSTCLAIVPRVETGDLVTAGEFQLIYNTSKLDGGVSWYINDHTMVVGPQGKWHMFGITHTDSADPEFEVNFAHAITSDAKADSLPSPTATLAEVPFALGAESPETHLWAPYVIYAEGMYHMVYCAGGNDRLNYMINYATSYDLWRWERQGTLFTDGVDGRDPVLVRLGKEHDNAWALYYTATNPDQLQDQVHHITRVRLSTSPLIARNWSAPITVFDGGQTGSSAGGPTESPFVVRRGSQYYLFSGSWTGYSDTRVFVSSDPLNFGSVVDGSAKQVGEIPSHAPEVVRAVDGKWYITRAGWGQGGLYIAPLTWNDGLSDDDTSLPPPPIPVAPQPTSTTNLNWASIESYDGSSINGAQRWLMTSSGLIGGAAMTETVTLATNTTKNTAFSYICDVQLVTVDGNPDYTPRPETRGSTLAGLVFFGYNSTTLGGYSATISTANGGALLIQTVDDSPQSVARILAQVSIKIPKDSTVRLTVNVKHTILHPNKWTIFASARTQDGSSVNLDAEITDPGSNKHFLGLHVATGSAIFNNIQVDF